MLLTFDKQINLTEYEDNPSPKVVAQLGIIHESQDGDLTQYYINIDNHSEGDKATNALGIPVEVEPEEGEKHIEYEYTDYDKIKWGDPKARITRRRIDRLGVVAFPNVGAIAHYKLAYQNLSKIVAPVNYKVKKTKAPTLKAEVNADGSVTFTLIPPAKDDNENITYMCYRIVMILDHNRLEYITYTTELTIDKPLVTGTYTIYAIGYVNEGEIVSDDSNVLEMYLQGEYSSWPAVTPGSEIPQRLSDLRDVQLNSLSSHQLMRYGSNNKWENFKPADIGASEIAAVITAVKYNSAISISVTVNSDLKSIVNPASILVSQNGTSIAISTVSISGKTLSITLSSELSADFDTQILKSAFAVEVNDTAVVHTNIPSE